MRMEPNSLSDEQNPRYIMNKADNQNSTSRKTIKN